MLDTTHQNITSFKYEGIILNCSFMFLKNNNENTIYFKLHFIAEQ